MARTDVMREFRYREDFKFCQDIELWSRVSSKYPLANLPRYLIQYRLGGDSHQDDALAVDLKKQVAGAQLHYLGVDYHESDLQGHHQLRNLNRFKPDAAYIDWCEEWLLKLIATNAKNHCYPEPEFTVAAAERWYRLGLAAGPVALATRFFSSPTLRRTLPTLVTSLGVLGANLAAAKFLGHTQPRARVE